jgi:hypothetical protein
MTPNIKRLGALAAVQCGSFVIVVLLGTLGGPGHQAHTSSVPAHHTARPTVSASPATSANGNTSTRSPSRPHTSAPASRTGSASGQAATSGEDQP